MDNQSVAEKKYNQNKKNAKTIPPSATFVPMTSNLEKKMGKSTDDVEGLNASTQRTVGQ